MSDNFTKRLNEALTIRDIKPAELAARSGLSKASISQYCNGVYVPKPDKLYLIAEALKINPAWLMGYDVSMEYDKSKLETEVQLCDLVTKCYGKEAYRLVKMYLALNQDGKEKAFDYVKDLTEQEKYTVKRDSKEAM